MVAITESWINDSDQIALGNICPTGYNTINEPRGKIGGGIVVIYKSTV